MIFKPELCEAILAGRKTQTRRLVEPDDVAHGTWVERDGRRKWRIGDTYAIQSGRGGKAVGRIVITDISRERLTRINDAGILAEGVDGDTELLRYCAFASLWDSIHGGGSFNRDPMVWVLTFKLAQP